MIPSRPDFDNLPSRNEGISQRVVFNIGGNKHRLVIAVKYSAQLVFIRFVGTHADCDDIDAEEV